MRRWLRRQRRRLLVWAFGTWRKRFVRCHACADLQRLSGRYAPRVLPPARQRPRGDHERLDPCRHVVYYAGQRWH